MVFVYLPSSVTVEGELTELQVCFEGVDVIVRQAKQLVGILFRPHRRSLYHLCFEEHGTKPS